MTFVPIRRLCNSWESVTYLSLGLHKTISTVWYGSASKSTCYALDREVGRFPSPFSFEKVVILVARTNKDYHSSCPLLERGLYMGLTPSGLTQLIHSMFFILLMSGIPPGISIDRRQTTLILHNSCSRMPLIHISSCPSGLPHHISHWSSSASITLFTVSSPSSHFFFRIFFPRKARPTSRLRYILSMNLTSFGLLSHLFS